MPDRHQSAHRRALGVPQVKLRPGNVVVSIGTSVTVYGVSDEPTADPPGIVAGFADATGRHLPLVCTLNATKVTEAVRRLLGVDHEELDRLALAGAPGAGGPPSSRTSTGSAPRTGRTRPASSPGYAATSGASSSPAPRWRASCVGCSTASMRWQPSPPPAGS